MTTTSLELSRQLQEQWPEWETHFLWTAVSKQDNFHLIESNSIYNSGTRAVYIAPTLDELRVFALELIEKESGVKIDESKRVPGVLYGLHDRYVELKDALIQGCDPTASWILNTFGGK